MAKEDYYKVGKIIRKKKKCILFDSGFVPKD